MRRLHEFPARGIIAANNNDRVVLPTPVGPQGNGDYSSQYFMLKRC